MKKSKQFNDQVRLAKLNENLLTPAQIKTTYLTRLANKYPVACLGLINEIWSHEIPDSEDCSAAIYALEMIAMKNPDLAFPVISEFFHPHGGNTVVSDYIDMLLTRLAAAHTEKVRVFINEELVKSDDECRAFVLQLANRLNIFGSTQLIPVS